MKVIASRIVQTTTRFIAVLALAVLCARGAEGPTAEGRELRDELVREAAQPGKPAWRPMLLHLAELHGRSVLPAVAHFKYPYESIGPGYQDGRVFGHIDLAHIRLDTVRAAPIHVRNQTRNELAGQQADGLIPGIILFKADGQPSWKNFKGFPPFWVAAVEAYVEVTGDVDFLRECLDALRRQIGWFEAKRRLADGGFYYLDLVEKTWESGMDEGQPPFPALRSRRTLFQGLPAKSKFLAAPLKATASERQR